MTYFHLSDLNLITLITFGFTELSHLNISTRSVGITLRSIIDPLVHLSELLPVGTVTCRNCYLDELLHVETVTYMNCYL